MPAPPEGAPWELFHENSKITRFDPPQSPTAEQQRMAALLETERHDPAPMQRLPAPTPSATTLDAAIAERATPVAGLGRGQLRAGDLSTLLHNAYGVTHDLRAQGFPRAFRAVPSAGALYPLELYVLVNAVDGVGAGLHHYDPTAHALAQLADDAIGAPIADAFVQSDRVQAANVVVLIAALVPRTAGKYGDRGYRFALLEAGHLAQNLCLSATARGFAGQCLGGYRDRELDRALGFNGITRSVVYAVAVGRPLRDAAGAPAG
jgi:SagB-type dehydrogenase family enzyme